MKIIVQVVVKISWGLQIKHKSNLINFCNTGILNLQKSKYDLLFMFICAECMFITCFTGEKISKNVKSTLDHSVDPYTT